MLSPIPTDRVHPTVPSLVVVGQEFLGRFAWGIHFYSEATTENTELPLSCVTKNRTKPLFFRKSKENLKFSVTFRSIDKQPDSR